MDAPGAASYMNRVDITKGYVAVSMSMLKVWKTPFMSHSFPSVWFSVDTHLGNVNVFVKSDRRWRVRFDHIVGPHYRTL